VSLSLHPFFPTATPGFSTDCMENLKKKKINKKTLVVQIANKMGLQKKCLSAYCC
jgi:hypothetical protein